MKAISQIIDRHEVVCDEVVNFTFDGHHLHSEKRIDQDEVYKLITHAVKNLCSGNKVNDRVISRLWAEAVMKIAVMLNGALLEHHFSLIPNHNDNNYAVYYLHY